MIQGRIDVLIPHIQGLRNEGLQKCLTSLQFQTYTNIEPIIIDGMGTVPEKIRDAVSLTEGEYICYAANDMEFHPDCLASAVACSQKYKKSLVSFNEGPVYPDKGNICTHFLIRRDFLPFLENGEIFSTDFFHYGCDNWLHAQAEKLNAFMYDENAYITHNHFTKGAEFDEIYKKAMTHVTEDRETLRQKLLTLHSDGESANPQGR